MPENLISRAGITPGKGAQGGALRPPAFVPRCSVAELFFIVLTVCGTAAKAAVTFLAVFVRTATVQPPAGLRRSFFAC